MSSNGEVNASPTWLDKSFLEKALRGSEEKYNVTVNSFQVARATAPGDNYASDMYRIKIFVTRNGKQESESIIVKAEPAKEEMSKLLEECGMFRREATALYSIIPKMFNLLSAVSSQQIQPFSAECFYSQSQPSAIVLEDLKQKDFKMAKRMLGLDMEHSLLVMRQLARFHASSVALHQKNPELFDPIRDTIFVEAFRPNMEKFFENSMKKLAKEIKEWSNYEQYAAKMQTIADNCVDLVIESAKRDESDFNVFVHGDMWLNNMMFSYSEKQEVEQVRFLDLQMCHYSSPALDIHYFLHTSVSLDLLDKHLFLIEEYYKTLGETLSLLGYGYLTPTFAQLQKQLEQKGVFAIVMCGTVLPFVLADNTTIPDVEKMMKEEESGLRFSEPCKTAIKRLLPIFERKGWL